MAASQRRLTRPAVLCTAEGVCVAPRLARTVLSSYALLWAGTLLFTVLALPFTGPLHAFFGLRLMPAAPGTARMVALIAANNMREAAIPILFALLRTHTRWVLRLGDAVVTGCLVANIALGGLALGTYGTGLLGYLPHWPLEWAAFALSLTAWRRARRGERDVLELALLALFCVSLLTAAALIETYTVPQT